MPKNLTIAMTTVEADQSR